jgi:Flp pilus assembly protein TadG
MTTTDEIAIMDKLLMNRSAASHLPHHHTKESGVALIEFALILPVLLLLLVGGIEITRFVMAHQKVDKVASQMADFISQVPTPALLSATSPELTSTFQKLMSPFGTKDAGFVVSIVQLPLNKTSAEITSQTSNNASSAVGGVGTVLDADKIWGASP